MGSLTVAAPPHPSAERGRRWPLPSRLASTPPPQAGRDPARALLAATTLRPPRRHTLGDAKAQRRPTAGPSSPSASIRSRAPERPADRPRGGRAFHFGIDVAAPDGTSVYAVGAASSSSPTARSPCRPPGPRVRLLAHDASSAEGAAIVRTHRRGYVAWRGHVHFAERIIKATSLRCVPARPYTDPLALAVERSRRSAAERRGQILTNASTRRAAGARPVGARAGRALIHGASFERQHAAAATAVDFRSRSGPEPVRLDLCAPDRAEH